ncbi:MAG: hypothetical protein Q8O89_01780 [Nanoarchaeota archaeon]|nr:hypothetical protein [Nanoarchaeota archaeon]
MDFDFGKKPAQAPGKDPITENFKELANIEKRLAGLEQAQERLDLELDDKEKVISQDLEEFKNQIEAQTKNIQEMKADLREFIKTVMLFVKELQKTAKNEELERLQQMLEEWTPENWVTRNEIIRMTERILQEEK